MASAILISRCRGDEERTVALPQMPKQFSAITRDGIDWTRPDQLGPCPRGLPSDLQSLAGAMW